MSKPSKQKIIKSLLESSFNIHLLEITNESYMHNVPEGSESHFKVILVSDSFKDVPKIKQHQTIYKALGNIMNQIHALSIHSFDKEEFNNNPMIIDSPNCVNKK